MQILITFIAWAPYVLTVVFVPFGLETSDRIQFLLLVDAKKKTKQKWNSIRRDSAFVRGIIVTYCVRASKILVFYVYCHVDVFCQIVSGACRKGNSCYKFIMVRNIYYIAISNSTC